MKRKSAQLLAFIILAAIAIFILSVVLPPHPPRAEAYSGSISIQATPAGAFVSKNYPGTGTGLQQALDYVAASGGKVHIGPGLLLTSTAIWIHGNTTLTGEGIGITIILRNNGTMADGNAASSGAVIAVSRPGFNGTPVDSSNIQKNIYIANLTLNGNAPAFAAVTNAGLNQHGIYAPYIDGLTVENVEIKQTMRSGLFAQECRRVTVTNPQMDSIGQWSVVSTQNAIDFYNFTNKASSEGHGKGLVVTGGRITNVSYEAFSFTNVSEVNVTGTFVSGCKRVFEIQGGSNTAVDSGFVLVGINAYNFIQEAVSIGSNASGRVFKDITVADCNFVASPTLHGGRIVSIEPSTGSSVQGIRFQRCKFRNINSANSAGQAYVDFTTTATAFSEDVSFDYCEFYGGNMAASNAGIALTGKLSRIRISHTLLKDIPSVGVYCHPGANETVYDLSLDDVTVLNAGNDGIVAIENNNTNGAVIGADILNCKVIDPNRTTGNQGFRIGAISGSGGGVVRNVRMMFNSIRKTSGTNPLRGIRIEKGAGGTTDSISVTTTLAPGITAPYDISGTPTNVQLNDAAASFTNATLPTLNNGVEVYCSDCTIANPCAGGGTGARAKRINGAWVCN